MIDDNYDDIEFAVPDAPDGRELIGVALLIGGLSGFIMGAVIALLAVAVF